MGIEAVQSATAIEVTAVRLNASPQFEAPILALLDEQERQRTERFRLPHLAWSFAQSHAVLRLVIGSVTGIHPARMQFVAGPHGRPALAQTDLYPFSLSHSGGLVAVAIATDCQGGLEVGLDIERIRPIDDCEAIVERFFSVGEQGEFRSIDPPMQQAAFFHGWTRKEAFVKAKGLGLSIPLSSFTVPLTPTVPRGLGLNGGYVAGGGDDVEQPVEAEGDWRLETLSLEPEFAAALVYCGEPPLLRIHRTQDFDEFWRSKRAS